MLLNKVDVLCRTLNLRCERHSDVVFLEQSKHMRKNLRMICEASNVGCISDNSEHVLHDFDVMCLIEWLRICLKVSNVLQELEQDLKTDLGNIAHCVLERPDDRVENQFE